MSYLISVKCKNCLTFVEPAYFGEFVACKCFQDKVDGRGFYIDILHRTEEGNLVYRMGGNFKDAEFIDNGDLKE